jgi:hypothetical protein
MQTHGEDLLQDAGNLYTKGLTTMIDLTPAAAILTAAFGHTPAAPSFQTIPTSVPTAAPTRPQSRSNRTHTPV